MLSRRSAPIAICIAVLALFGTAPSAQQPATPPPVSSATALPRQDAAPNDLDAFMAKVLEKRNENWRTLHDYILSERETFEILGPADLPLHGLRREFHWFIKDGYLVRSPVKANGVALSAEERRKYEDRWLEDEKAREKKRQEDPKAGEAPQQTEVRVSVAGDVEISGLGQQGPEPRFISEAYFMKFKFEPGNYYFAGRERLDGREVLKIEYLPSKLFADDEHRAEQGGAASPETKKDAAADKPRRRPRERSDKDAENEARLEQAMNKTSTVTMWIDPQEYQIVRFTFDNADWGFLPGRQLIRLDEARASMTMGRVFEQVWLPKDVTFGGSATFASGTVRVRYAREFYDYRRGEVSAKIRGYVPKEPRP